MVVSGTERVSILAANYIISDAGAHEMYQHGFQNSPCLANALSTHDDNTPMRKREADKTFRAMDYLKRPSLKSCQIYIYMYGDIRGKSDSMKRTNESKSDGL